MKKLIVFVLAAMLILAPLAYAGGGEESVSPGPAPNSGDGISDGSGIDREQVPIGLLIGLDDAEAGPAPNSGDGVSDGSGF